MHPQKKRLPGNKQFSLSGILPRLPTTSSNHEEAIDAVNPSFLAGPSIIERAVPGDAGLIGFGVALGALL